MVPVNFSVSSQGDATWVIFATTNTWRRSRKILVYLLHEEERKIFSKIYLVCLSTLWFLHILNSKVIQQYQIVLFGTEIDLSDANQQRGRQTRPKHHTYKDHKSKLKTQSEKLLHVSEVTGCCFILSFQGLEDSKGFISGIISTIIR